jgi:hypothetical protein
MPSLSLKAKTFAITLKTIETATQTPVAVVFS